MLSAIEFMCRMVMPEECMPEGIHCNILSNLDFARLAGGILHVIHSLEEDNEVAYRNDGSFRSG
jgi:hypothetical protein